jgi:hypothetical protein
MSFQGSVQGQAGAQQRGDVAREDGDIILC